MTDGDRPILVVSDDDTNAMVVSILLSRRGHPVTRSTSRDAPERIKAVRPSVVIYDTPTPATKPQTLAMTAADDRAPDRSSFPHMVLLGAPAPEASGPGEAAARPAFAVLQKPFNVDAAEKILSFRMSSSVAKPN